MVPTILLVDLDNRASEFIFYTMVIKINHEIIIRIDDYRNLELELKIKRID